MFGKMQVNNAERSCDDEQAKRSSSAFANRTVTYASKAPGGEIYTRSEVQTLTSPEAVNGDPCFHVSGWSPGRFNSLLQARRMSREKSRNRLALIGWSRAQKWRLVHTT